ncbi:MAG: O-antigen ligase family protein [Pirellulales bacterium]|nr:O-antigen ligase family protein [Pirellulales bacterium]
MAAPLFGWVVPYLVGRCALASRSDLDQMTKWLAIPIVLIGIAVAIECVTHFNVLSSYVGRTGAAMQRYGFARAMGPASHPIYLGMLMVLFLPWAIWGAYLGTRGEAPRWFRLLPVICAVGVLSSFSRGPFLAMCGVFVFVAFIYFRRYRMVIAGSAVAIVLAVIVGREMAIEGLRAAEGARSASQRPMMIVVDGELVEYDGTLHRLLLFKVYDDPIIEGGLLGHGPTQSETVLDLLDGHAAGVMYSIDNHYIIYALQFGFLGLIAFLCLAACGFIYGAQASMRSASPMNLFAAAQFGSTTLVTLGLMTVWFPNDFRGMWLFSLGCAVAWRVHGLGHVAEGSELPPPPAHDLAIRRLVPGHPSMTTMAK